jgi:hypothetical protein
MHSFILNVITSGRKEITVQKKGGASRCVRVTGFDPEAMIFAEDAKDLAALFTGVEKLLTD